MYSTPILPPRAASVTPEVAIREDGGMGTKRTQRSYDHRPVRLDVQTPGEMYFGTGDAVPGRLAAARRAARLERMATNRAARGAVCA